MEEVLGKKPGDFLQGEETNLAVKRFMRQKLKAVEPFECDIINYSKSGTKYWMRIQCQPQFNENGIHSSFFAIQTDITKEKEAEKFLKASEERYRHLFDNSPASIFIWDIETFQILEVNDTAVKLYGYSRNEFLGKTAMSFSLTEDACKIISFANTARKVFDFKLDITCIHIKQSGEEMHMSVGSHRISYKEHDAILALGTNITYKVLLERKLEHQRMEKEKEITDAVISAQERERHELGSELHDNINQILASSLLYLGMEKREMTEEHPFINESENLIHSAIKEIRNLSHSLIPPSFNESQLLEALNNIIDTISITSEIEVTLEAVQLDENLIPEKLQLSIYRIVQQQLSNILKYAAALNVEVKLVQENKKLTLIIKDDGVGFDTSVKSTGVGLKNIKTRASLFDGDMTIISSPGNGCEMKVFFLLDNV